MKTIIASSHIKTNDRIEQLITRDGIANKKILDIGAGRGYMSQKIGSKLKQEGISVADALTACDLFPEYFEYDEIPCEKLHFMSKLPYEDGSFDIVYSIEVIEHLSNPVEFIKEVYRILKTGGRFIFSTPNVLNINSRLSYLGSGFFKLFGPLSYDHNKAGLLAGHIMPISYYYLYFFARKEGFRQADYFHDRIKSSSVWYYIFFYLFIQLSKRLVINRAKRKGQFEENRLPLETMNSFKMHCSRGCILDCLK